MATRTELHGRPRHIRKPLLTERDGGELASPRASMGGPVRNSRPSGRYLLMVAGPGVSPVSTGTPQTGWPDLHQALSGTPAHGLGMVGRSDGSGFRVTVPVLG